MTTMLVVHGTGVREPRYSQMVDQITRAIHKSRPDVAIAPCPWGNAVGARLGAEGASIPLYDSTRAIEQVDDDEAEIELWKQLYQDPWYELRSLAVMSDGSVEFVPGQLSPGEELDEHVRTMVPSPRLQALLIEAGIGDVWEAAREELTQSPPYREAILDAGQDSDIYRVVVARAMVAQAMAICEEQELYPAILTDATLRDAVVLTIQEHLGDTNRSVLSGMLKPLLGLPLRLAMNHVQRRRGAITDAVYPFAGDILLYQARGAEIRAWIRACIQQAAPPVVVLAHSLGGVACVDLLVEEPMIGHVHQLITVGSQVPFLYEINALQSLSYETELPPSPQFPPWLNIYDLRDFLSYTAARIFTGRVDDVLVDSRQPFPRSHSAYWTNPATWKTILPRLP